MKTSLFAAGVMTAALFSVGANGAASAVNPVNDRPSAPTVSADDVGAAAAGPLLSRPSTMSPDQWYSVDPRTGFSFATMSVAYKNGARAAQILDGLKAGNGAVYAGGVNYTPSMWREFARYIHHSPNFMLYGLKRWYDADTTNDGFMTYDPSKVWQTPVPPDGDGNPIGVVPGVSYDAHLGFNPNYFASKAEQDAFVADMGIIFNRTPFENMFWPGGQKSVYDDYECFAGGLFMYSDGTTPSPNSGEWAESWNRAKPEGFDAASADGSSPYRPKTP